MMSELADLLEVMHLADGRWRSVQVDGREWIQPDLSMRAFLRAAQRRNSASLAAGSPGAVAPPQRESPWRLWRSKPGLVRAEFDVGADTVTAVVRDATWWSWASTGPVRTNGGQPGSSVGQGPGEALLRPAAVLPALELRVLGSTTLAGRPAIRAGARPLRIPTEGFNAESGLHGIGTGADEYELVIDVQRGVLLRVEARLTGEPFRVLEVHRIEFDLELSEDTFAPPRSRPLAPVSRSRTMELHQAPTAVPFAVFVPERPPPGSYPPDVMIDMPDPVRGNPLMLYVTWATPPDNGRAGRSYDRLTVMEAAEPLPEPPGIAWEDLGGLQVGTDRNVVPAHTRVRRVISGTHVDLSSDDIPRERLLSYARSMVRLPELPPRLRKMAR